VVKLASKIIGTDASGNIYSRWNRERRIDFHTWTKSTGITSTVSIMRGNQTVVRVSGRFRAAIGYNEVEVPLAVDASGNIYFVDTGKIRLMTKSTNVVTTVAGGKNRGFSGDGGSALLATIDPETIALDASENIYICEYGNHRIRMVTKSTGIITTLAGDGSSRSSGDGGPAISAAIGNPIVLLTVALNRLP
jgi:trimeric autotransporter adhesin